MRASLQSRSGVHMGCQRLGGEGDTGRELAVVKALIAWPRATHHQLDMLLAELDKLQVLGQRSQGKEATYQG